MRKTESIVLKPIGAVRAGRVEPVDDRWDSVPSVIELDAGQLGPDTTAGLGEFSHIEVVFHFDRVSEREIQTGARHPRGRTDWPKIGILAQRGKGRPNRIGVTVCRLLRVEELVLRVRRSRRDRRDPRARYQAGHVGVPAARRDPRAALGQGDHGGLLVGPADALRAGPASASSRSTFRPGCIIRLQRISGGPNQVAITAGTKAAIAMNESGPASFPGGAN